MNRFIRASTALVALAAASAAFGQYMPPRGPYGAPPPPLYPPAPPPTYRAPAPAVQPQWPAPQQQQPQQWSAPQPVQASFETPRDDQPIEPVEIPASIE